MTVQIGLGKNTKLESVFERYVQVCKNRDPSHAEVTLDDIEFVHSTVLKGHETAEQAALMKDDRVRVRPERSAVTQQEKERAKLQREFDHRYFSDMKGLLRPDPDEIPTLDTVVLECHGRLPPPFHGGRYFYQIPCVVSIASTRCLWLRRIIQGSLANQDADQKKSAIISSFFNPGAGQDSLSSAISGGQDSTESMKLDDDEEDEPPIRMVDRSQIAPQAAIQAAAAAPAAAEIEMEGEEDVVNEVVQDVGSGRVVIIADHPVEAIQVLLEYCYTNRVVSLGVEAFKVAARTKLDSRGLQGNLAPFSLSSGAKKWPARGQPTISMDATLAALALAEEASMPRLSLMCEVAAAELVSPVNAVNALSLCARIDGETGNNLNRLRQAAMDVLLHMQGKRAVGESVRLALKSETESKALVPTLLKGLVDSMTERMDSRSLYEYENRDWQTTAFAFFDQVDREDSYKRARERRQRRVERHPDGDTSLIVDEYEARASSNSLKRVRGHSIRPPPRRKAARKMTITRLVRRNSD